MVLAEVEATIIEVSDLNKSQSEFQVNVDHSVSFGGAKYLSLKRKALVPADILNHNQPLRITKSPPTMANPGLATAQMLPRFLLPKLSWQAGAVGRQSLRTLSIAARTQVSFRDTFDHRKNLAQSSRPPTLGASNRIVESLPRSRGFHATTRQGRDHHFDTLKFVQRLKEEGFTEEQSVAMMKVLSDVIEERCSY